MAHCMAIGAVDIHTHTHTRASLFIQRSRRISA